ncbi:polysaccharide pyruvyl transferase family protein [Phascolarctobacterium faecium]|uniref:polysaccharide pyruvyl transferase family protein n=1 Tax=Phascolarctobacterium faecium TaxID=33025 RepID=UPI003AAD18F6
MKIGILTYSKANNFGAMMQALALKHTLEERYKADVYFVNYYSVLQENNDGLKLKICNMAQLVKQFIRMPFRKQIRTRIQKFTDFRSRNFVFSSKKMNEYTSQEELVEEFDKFDIIIVGSDQVWNVENDGFTPVYYLPFKLKARKITYAASIGVSQVEKLKEYSVYMDDFFLLSTREEKAKKILEECTHKTVDVVLDPTLFVDSDFYDTLLKGYKCEYLAVKEKYMLAVFYGRKNLSKFRKSAEKLAQKFSLPLKIINVNFGAAAYASNLINDAGPLDFLSLIKNAECVCTNSFHNMAFALIYDRPFYVFEDNALDVRKVGILKTLKLQDRIVYGDDISSITKLDCDFKENKLILDHLKLQSFACLDQIDRLGSIQI